MRRLSQVMLIGSTLAASWFAMQAVHESGHVSAAWISGARVTRVVLYPLTISRTDVADNTHPLLVAWAGPLVGIVVPLFAWAIAFAVRFEGTFVFRFFAGFCLLANGLYIGYGSINGVGDCGDMLRHGSKPWQLWLFGLVAAPPGLWLWNGQGRYFGLGRDRVEVNRRVAVGVFAALVGLLVLEFAFGAE